MATDLLTGTVQSGDATGIRPIGKALVTVYEATSELSVVGSGITNINGKFMVTVSSTQTDGIFYVTANMGNGVLLVTIIGPLINRSIIINELTTVAAAFSMAQFARDGAITGNEFGLRLAWGMNDNLVSTDTGASSEVMLNSPNADETNSLRSTRALANLLAACVQQQPCAAATLFVLATPPHGPAPGDTFEALVNIARHPANNVAGIYTQSKSLEIYLPSLERMPDAWTLAVKVNRAGYEVSQSGSVVVPFGGPGNLVFDKNGYAWIANNVFQGTPRSGNYIIVLKPNGKPADGENGMPKSPITGGGILGPGFGVTIDTDGDIWVGNFGWGGKAYEPSSEGNGSVSQFNASGQAISGDQGYQGGAERVQGLVPDQDNNIWLASYGNNSVVVFLKGDWTNSISASVPIKRGRPFDIAIAQDGSAWVTNCGGLWEGMPSSICKFSIVNGENGDLELQQTFKMDLGHTLKGISLDSKGNAWAASGGDSAVYLLSPEGELLGKFSGGGINSPWSATVDGDDNVWVSNFGPMTKGDNFTTSALSKLAGANPDTRPPGLKTGDPISPQTGYTLHSAGSPVLLPNNEPLYGTGGPECRTPLMRLTNCAIDQAGNVWAINNWKPDFDIDASPKTGNPGGDGIVIFVGLAKPPTKNN